MNRYKKFYRNMVRILIVLFILGAIPEGEKVYADTPRVMLTEYSFSKDDIYAGDSFTLSFTLKNTYKYEIRNLKCTLISEAGEFLPVNSACTSYVEKIKGGETVQMSFDLEALKNLEEKAYKLTVKTEYEDWNGSYNVEDIIYVPIKLTTDMVVSDIYIAEENIHLGDNIEILATVNNTGAGKLYKVMAKAEGDHIDTGTGYIGNIEPGKSGNVDIVVKTKALKDSGVKNNLIVSYESLDGEEFSQTISLGRLDVKPQVYADLIEVKEDTSKSFFTDNMKLAAVIGTIILIIVILIIRRRIKLRKLEKEFD